MPLPRYTLQNAQKSVSYSRMIVYFCSHRQAADALLRTHRLAHRTIARCSMEFFPKKVSESIYAPYLRLPVVRGQFRTFVAAFSALAARINREESEENLKNIVADFLKAAFYAGSHEVNTKGRADLVIHAGKSPKDPVAVLMELKRPANDAEMLAPAEMNRKALHEAVLYYLTERVEHKNSELKTIVITNAQEWYFFKAADFEQAFHTSELLKAYKEWSKGDKLRATTDFFYREIVKPYIAQQAHTLNYTHIAIHDYAELIAITPETLENAPETPETLALYKLFSPSHLLREPFSTDANHLNQAFYDELLHIMGVEERKFEGKIIIDRIKDPAKRHPASLIENVLNILTTRRRFDFAANRAVYGESLEEQQFGVALELCTTWLNRVLFLKLLEAMLIRIHRQPEQDAPAWAYFLHPDRIRDHDELDELFFEVLAIREADRKAEVRAKYPYVPYLNSALFQLSELEGNTTTIGCIKDRLEMPLYERTVLADERGNSLRGTAMPSLRYLLSFLDAYDFGADAYTAVKDSPKNLINAAVLGLIFEKINGFREGAVFTPGYITTYMCREAVRETVLRRFSEAYQQPFASCHELKNFIQNSPDFDKNNAIFMGVRICDPSVGSGHFLVSVLNELLLLKNELGLIRVPYKNTILPLALTHENEEIYVTDLLEGGIMTYNFGAHAHIPVYVQFTQEIIFNEKRQLIEHCLFGVDINPNSVQICRLRLWIELLKSSYYHRNAGDKVAKSHRLEFETLPNIDINIKTGNSLVSRYRVTDDLGTAFRNAKYTPALYRMAVEAYKNTTDAHRKEEHWAFIQAVKDNVRVIVSQKDPELLKIKRLENELFALENEDLFGKKGKNNDSDRSEIEKLRLSQLIEQARAEVAERKSGAAFRRAFEWRIEFPEVLDDEGNFLGFDLVIGNPPYISLSKVADQRSYALQGYTTYAKGADLYCLFFERGRELLREGGKLAFITSNSWMKTQYGELLRRFFLTQTNPTLVLDFGETQVFRAVTVASSIVTYTKSPFAQRLIGANVVPNFAELPTDALVAYIAEHQVPVTPENGNPWMIGGSGVEALMRNIQESESAKSLSELYEMWDLEVYRGVTTGNNEAFVISQEIKEMLIGSNENSRELIFPLLRGRNLQKYVAVDANEYLIFTRRGLNIDDYPAIQQHLAGFREELEPKKDKKTEKGRKAGSYKWFEIQDNTAYYPSFSKPKIIWGELSDEPKFTYDENSYYLLNTVFFMTGKNLHYLLGIFNSSLSKWYFEKISTTSGMGTTRWLKYKIEQLPIHVPSKAEQAELEALVAKRLVAAPESAAAIEAEINACVYRLYQLSPAEIALIQTPA